MSQRERAQSAKTLICLLQSLQGMKTKIELRNDHYLIGTIKSVDGYMNIEVENAKMYSLNEDEGEQIGQFEYFFIKGTRIRYVHIPDQVDVIKNIEKQLGTIQSRRKKIAKQEESN